jgi:hypothetical protein
MPRLYDEPTKLLTFRLSAPQRALLETLATKAGTHLSHYMRDIVEAHLLDHGYPLNPGQTAVTDPQRDTSRGWVRDHTQPTPTGQRITPTHGAPHETSTT